MPDTNSPFTRRNFLGTVASAALASLAASITPHTARAQESVAVPLPPKSLLSQRKPRLLLTKLETDLYKLIPIPFVAQYPVGHDGYVVDAAIPEIRLAFDAAAFDETRFPEAAAWNRQQIEKLKANGWTVLRFTPDAMRDYPALCTGAIMLWVNQLQTKKYSRVWIS